MLPVRSRSSDLLVCTAALAGGSREHAVPANPKAETLPHCVRNRDAI